MDLENIENIRETHIYQEVLEKFNSKSKSNSFNFQKTGK